MCGRKSVYRLLAISTNRTSVPEIPRLRCAVPPSGSDDKARTGNSAGSRQSEKRIWRHAKRSWKTAAPTNFGTIKINCLIGVCALSGLGLTPPKLSHFTPISNGNSTTAAQQRSTDDSPHFRSGLNIMPVKGLLPAGRLWFKVARHPVLCHPCQVYKINSAIIVKVSNNRLSANWFNERFGDS